MDIKVPGIEINRMMKTIGQCIDPKDQNLGNIEIIYDNGLLTIRGSNGQFSAVARMPLLGGTGETFQVDGTMFARVCAACSGDVQIMTDGKVCTVKGAGKTRMPIVNAKIPAFKRVSGDRCEVLAEDLMRAYGGVAHAVSTLQTRVVLTGIYAEAMPDGLRLTALDGFRMAQDVCACDADPMKALIPGGFLKIVCSSISAGERVVIISDGKRVMAETDGMMVSCGLLTGEFPKTETIVPKAFKTDVLVKTEELRNALKGSSVINSSNKLVRLEIGGDGMKVMNNSEQADYEAEIGCVTHGDGIAIAFNQKYLMDAIGSLEAEEIVLKLNTPFTPVVMEKVENAGFRLVLPVRTVN